MTFGTIKLSVAKKIDMKDYADLHRIDGCEGAFGIFIGQNVPFNFDAIGMSILPFVPYIHCNNCKASFLAPGFEDFAEHAIAFQLITTQKLLLPKEVRFLRLVFDLTQQDVADFLECQRTYYSKCESEKNPNSLSSEKLKLLKLFYAERLGVDNPDVIYRMIKNMGQDAATLDTSHLFPKEQIDSYIRELGIENDKVMYG